MAILRLLGVLALVCWSEQEDKEYLKKLKDTGIPKLPTQLDSCDWRPKVNTTQGLICGVYCPGGSAEICGQHWDEVKTRKYKAFAGIPFAKPPVKELRFKNPVPGEAWSGYRDGGWMPPNCTQLNMMQRLQGEDAFIGHEDCLYLNVYVPEVTTCKTGLPVMVWIHGGAFAYGGIQDYFANKLMTHDVVLVSIQYRLGILGFLSTGDDVAPGNLALKDQELALRWVQDNIGRFGGDRSKVTIFGESAGGISAHLQMLNPNAKGLFSRVIMQSGTALFPLFQEINHKESAIKVANELGCTLKKDGSLALTVQYNGTNYSPPIPSNGKKKVYNVGPQGMLWHYHICPYLGGHRDSLKGCKDRCSLNHKCNAFNYVPGESSRCTLIECPIPIPEPTWNYNQGWIGYFLQTENSNNSEKTLKCLQNITGASSSEAIIMCLQDITEASSFVKVISNFNDLGVGPVPYSFRYKEDTIIPGYPEQLLREGRYNMVDVMMGINQNDGGYITKIMFSKNLTKPDDIRHYFLQLGEEKAYVAKQMLQYYLNGIRKYEEDDANKFTEMFGDYLLAIPHDYSLGLHSRDSLYGKKIYAYELKHRGVYGGFHDVSPQIGKHYVNHMEDLQYLLQDVINSGDNEKLENIMLSLWTNFANHGNPTPDNSLNFTWAPVTLESTDHLVLKPEPYMEADTRCQRRKFMSSLNIRMNNALLPEQGPILDYLESSRLKLLSRRND